MKTKLMSNFLSIFCAFDKYFVQITNGFVAMGVSLATRQTVTKAISRKAYTVEKNQLLANIKRNSNISCN